MDGLTELINLVKSYAPSLAINLASPFWKLGVSLLSSVFGEDSKQDDIIARLLSDIRNDSDHEIKIREIETKHQEALLQIVAANYATEVDDRKSARQREISIRDYVPTFLAIGFLLNYAVVQFYLVTHPQPVNDLISARFQDVLIMIISYYFGSSHKDKPQT